ncbi:MAG: TIGR03905 family TSCPD domain-containing protein [Lachnospiraceae bacterium]|nr:TIGR03905 family TSCPD domain-containing protein [Lachnospiraceae bacterium]
MTFKTQGVCSTKIDIEMDGDIIKKVEFTGGCHGNLQGICKLVEGLPKDEVISKLGGIRCGFKATSCPDQLARALKSL